MVRKGQLLLTVRGEVSATERGQSGFAGVSLRLIGPNSTLTALSGQRFSDQHPGYGNRGSVAAIAGTWNRNVAGGDLSLGAGLEHEPGQENATMSGQFRHRIGSLSTDLVRSNGVGPATTQYSVGLQTTFVAGGGTLQLSGLSGANSMIVAGVNGAREDDMFDLLINEQVAGAITGDRPLAVALAGYRSYDVRIRPVGAGAVAYDNAPRTLTLYPGTVARLDWAALPITLKIGRLVTPDGAPVSHASITGSGIWTETDKDGYFQIEAPDYARLIVTLPDSRTFTTTLPAGKPDAGMVRLGSVVCCGRVPVRLGTFEVPAELQISEAR
jgi:hypothetical protein